GAHRLEGAVEHGHGLAQVDDMDAVAHAEDVRGHLRVPAAGVVAEMNARLEQLAHGEAWQSHASDPFPVGPPRALSPGRSARGRARPQTPDRAAGMSPRPPESPRAVLVAR